MAPDADKRKKLIDLSLVPRFTTCFRSDGWNWHNFFGAPRYSSVITAQLAWNWRQELNRIPKETIVARPQSTAVHNCGLEKLPWFLSSFHRVVFVTYFKKRS